MAPQHVSQNDTLFPALTVRRRLVTPSVGRGRSVGRLNSSATFLKVVADLAVLRLVSARGITQPNHGLLSKQLL